MNQCFLSYTVIIDDFPLFGYGTQDISQRNDNPLVFETFDKAVRATPNVHPLLHSEKGFPYTNRAFHQKLDKAGMTKAMSRVAHCINNGPLEGLWGILKRELYSCQRFTGKMDLSQMILHPLLQHPARTAQPWRPDADGKARTLSRSIKSD